MELNIVYNEDCLETMKRMPDKSVDLVLTDPPYGINASSQSLGLRKEHNHKRKWNKKEWDNETPSQEIFNEIFRISKHQIIFGSNYFNLPPHNHFIVWDKDMSGDVPFAKCELAWTSFNKAPTIIKIRIQSENEERHHPTQKPLKLFTNILRDYALKNDYKTIYDPFMGSGTTAIACKSLGLDYIGSELDKDYFEIINKRLQSVQGSLF